MSPTILLVNPPIYDFAAYDMFNKPVGLLYLASFLRTAGYEVRLVDSLDRNHPNLPVKGEKDIKTRDNGTGKYHTTIIERPSCLAHVPRYYRRYGLPAEQLENILTSEYQNHKPLAVLVTSMMTYWYPAVADTIQLIGQTNPGIPVGLGGVYARLMPEHARARCRPDVIFSENHFLPVLKWLDNLSGIDRSYNDISEKFLENTIPAYDLYGRLDYITLITSLGCPFSCQYCASSFLQPHLQQLTPERFVEQLTTLLGLLDKRKSFYNIALMDDALLARPESHIIPVLRRCREQNLPLRFYSPNGLHIRFLTRAVAELMYANRFEMIRLSYESSDSAGRWQRASDDKVSDREFHESIAYLTDAGYDPCQIEAYILTGLPGQSMSEIETSAKVVHKLGVKIRLCQFSPIPHTPLFQIACDNYGIDPEEPLLHNNSILPALDKRIGHHVFQQFKNTVQEMNRDIAVPGIE